ncbi:MAG: ATP-binding cassette domain-containing protein [Lachnospiraceae bacterium]|nr:ATP-binding cassette domain-containing protein [Lachnospiraceae bacterium]
MEYALQTKSLEKQYKKYHALRGVTMNVPKGSIYGFVGKNGAGKPTLFRQVGGLQEPPAGEYFIYGKSNHDRDIIKSRRRMAAVVETPSIYREMTAEENLKEQYRVLGLSSFDDIPDLLKMVGLEDTGKKKAKNFSLGMRQRLGIAVALAGNPDFLMLDEPINGLDPEGIIEMRELIRKLNHVQGITILISSHILDELARVATHFGFIDKGVIVQEIIAAELEHECRKRIYITVTDTAILGRMLDEMGLEYKILSQTEAQIFGETEITTLVLKLTERNCRVKTLSEQEENLESYFMNLVGAKRS